MKVKEESEKVGLKLNIQKINIMAFGPIISWQIEGKTVADFIFLGSKITADGDCIESVMPSNILSSVVPFSSCLQSFPASGSLLMS